MATDNNNQTLEQLENLLATYDERGLRLIQDYLKSHTVKTRRSKRDEHQSVREILDEVHGLQHHIARIGQVHIVDHHRGNTQVLVATPDSLIRWESGKSIPLPPIKSPTIQTIHAMDSFSYTGGDGKVWEYASIVANKNRILTFNLHNPKDHIETNIPGTTVHSSLHIYPNEYYLNEGDLGIVKVTFEDGRTNSGPTTIIRHSHSTVDIPGGIKSYRSFRGRMAFDISGKQLYIADPGHGIRRIDVDQQKPVVTNLYDSFPIKIPIDIAFDQELRLLLVLDANTRKIYGSLVDHQQSYPSFNRFEQALQLPDTVLTNGASFTYCCWLKRGSDRSKDWKQHIPDSLFGFYINEGDSEITVHYHADGEARTASFAAQLPKSDWFHFSWIKRGEQFEFLINDRSYQLPAPGRIDLNRELPQKSHPVLFCVPGYTAAEIAIWDRDLSAAEIREKRSVWLTGMPAGLTGYWHLQISNREVVWTKDTHTFQDASGHGNDLTGNQLTWQLAASPLSALLPLYSIPGKEISQGLTADSTLNRLYWCEALDNGHTRLMRGSITGHTTPVVLEVFKHPVIDLRVKSASNDAFEELILAHARRRRVMQEAIQGAALALEQHALDVDAGHEQVKNAHVDTQESLALAISNRNELTQLLQDYKNVLDETHRVEKQKERQVAQARLDAIGQARKMVAEAHLKAAAIRREGGQSLLPMNTIEVQNND